jgi:hypothetical protein
MPHLKCDETSYLASCILFAARECPAAVHPQARRWRWANSQASEMERDATILSDPVTITYTDRIVSKLTTSVE